MTVATGKFQGAHSLTYSRHPLRTQMPFRLSDESLGEVKEGPGTGNFLEDLKVPDVSNIEMSQSYGYFELLGSIGRGFKAEI